MKKFFMLLFLQLTLFGLSAQNSLQNAAEAYSKGEFSKAVDLYEQVIKEEGESANIYYNIGNCYYKLNKLAPAILNYERSLLFDPGDSDIRFNLEVVKLKTIDKIEPVGGMFLDSWIRYIENKYSTNEWSYIGIVCFILLIASLVLFFFSRKIVLKKIGFYAGIVLLVFCLCSNAFSYRQKKELANRNTAIIFSQTTTLKSSPDASGTNLFVLHEGTKVTVKSKLGEWCEVRTAAEDVGWIKKDELVVI